MAGFEQATALPVLGAVLAAPVNLPASATTPVLSIPLTAGTWRLAVSVDVAFTGGTATLIEGEVQAGTATVTFTGGPVSDGVQMGNAAGGVAQGEITMDCLAIVTAAGTLSVVVKNPSATIAGTALASSGSFPASSGWSAIKVA